jgi:hypothetical protein
MISVCLVITLQITGMALVRMSERTLQRLFVSNPEDSQAIWREILKLRLKIGMLELKEFQQSENRAPANKELQR